MNRRFFFRALTAIPFLGKMLPACAVEKPQWQNYTSTYSNLTKAECNRRLRAAMAKAVWCKPMDTKRPYGISYWLVKTDGKP